jgi:hypothetical protein
MRIEIGKYICHWEVFDDSKPLLISFENRTSAQLKYPKNGWAENFCNSQKINYICVITNHVCWYLDDDIHLVASWIKLNFQKFHKKKVGYGGSMGGFAAANLSEILDLDKLILLNPISSLSNNVAPFENRFEKDTHLFGTGGFYDAAKISKKMQIYMVWDRFQNQDNLHAKRFKVHNADVKTLITSFSGHGAPIMLVKYRVLKLLINEVLNDECHLWSIRKVIISKNKRNVNYLKKIIEQLYNKKKFYSLFIVINYCIKNNYKATDTADMLRDFSVILKVIDNELAYKLITMAQAVRPSGKVINTLIDNWEVTGK